MTKLTQRKVAIWILGLALGALVLDKAVLAPGGASAASPEGVREGASPVASPRPASERARDATAAPGSEDTSENGPGQVSSRLSIALDSPKWTANEVVGSLRPSPEWASDRPAEAPATQSTSDAFKSRHSLKAVLSGPSKRMALIGGRTMNEGETLDGYTLVSVGARSAVFESGSDRIVLSLPNPPGKPGAPRTDR